MKRDGKAGYISTFDVGTTAVKGVLVDEAGHPAAARSFEIPTLFAGDRKEQDPQSWWDAFREISLELTKSVPPAQIEALVMSGQMQDLIPLDRALNPVYNAILYSDGRAGEQAKRIEEAVGAEHFLSITGNRCDGSLPLPKLLWLKEHRPDLYARTSHVLISSKDYLIARLTGVCAGDVTSGSTAGAMDIFQKRWSGELLASAGAFPDLFPKLFAAHRRVGGMLPEAAGDCGYLPGTPVFAGTGDAGAATLASGIAAPGQYNINLGTSGWVAAVSDSPLVTQEGVFNLAAMPEGRYINVVPFLNAGNVHSWIAGVMAGFSGREVADFDALGALLAQSVPGSGGMLFLPYLVGERFPVLDPDARGTELLPAMAMASAALLGLGKITCYEQFTESLGGMETCVRYTPCAGSEEVYGPLYERFCRLHPALRALW